jgi:hypothetical protein
MNLFELCNDLNVTNVSYHLKDRTEDELISLLNHILPNETVFLQLMRHSKTLYGYTYKDNSCSDDKDAVSIIVICEPNYFVLLHEIAHILDNRPNKINCHDDIYINIWQKLLNDNAY